MSAPDVSRVVHALALLTQCIQTGSQRLTDTAATVARDAGATRAQVHDTIAAAGGSVLA